MNYKEFMKGYEEILDYKPDKPFKLLTEEEKKERMKIYEKQREIYNVKESLFAITHIEGIKSNKDGSQRFCFTAKNYKTGEKMKFNAYIGKGKDALKEFYKSLTVGQNVSIHYQQKTVNGTTFNSAKQVILR